MRRFALALAFMGACKPIPVESATPGEPTGRAATNGDAELAAVARRIDPGPRSPLDEVLPAWLKNQFDPGMHDPKSAESVAVAIEGIGDWDRVAALVEDVERGREDPRTVYVGAMKLGAGVLLAERAVAAGNADPALLAALSRAYRAVHELGEGGGSTLVRLAGPGGTLSSAQIEAVTATARTLAEHAAALQMHVTARVLREHSLHPAVSEVLYDASLVKLTAEQYAEAVSLRRLAVARMGDHATSSQFGALAMLCYRALDLRCGDLARKTAEERGPDVAGETGAAVFKQRLADLDALAETARKAMAPAQSFEEKVAQGHLLLELGRVRDAEAVFTALRASHPNDARPLTGLAVLAIRRGLDDSVLPQIRAARELAGRDRAYYELALGTVAPLVIGEMAASTGPSAELDARFEEVLALLRGYREFDPARAAVLELLGTTARSAFPKLVAGERDAVLALFRKLPEQALALAKKFPESGDTWRLLFFMSRLAGSQDRARALVTMPIPPALLQRDPDLRLQQARALVDLALSWEDRTLLAAATQAAAELPASIPARDVAIVRAALDAVAARDGDLAAAQRALAVYMALAERTTGRERAIALNNAAVMAAHLGQAKPAATLLARAHEAAPEESTPNYNMNALAFAQGASAALAEQFAASAKDSPIAALRLHARAWLVALAEAGQGDGAALRREFAAALADERAGELLGTLRPGRWGVVEQNGQTVWVAYSTRDGLLLIDEVVPRWWLMVPAPTFDALVAAKKRTTR